MSQVSMFPGIPVRWKEHTIHVSEAEYDELCRHNLLDHFSMRYTGICPRINEPEWVKPHVLLSTEKIPAASRDSSAAQ